MIDVRCDRRTQFRATDDGEIEIHCRTCSHALGRTVLHQYRFDPVAEPGKRWVRLDDAPCKLAVVGMAAD